MSVRAQQQSSAGECVAIVGLGDVAERAYIPAMKELDLVIAAVLEPRIDRAVEAASLCPSAKVCGDLNMLDRLRLPHRTLAVNLTPAPMHEQVIRELIERGFDVLTEKPATTSVDTWHRLAEEANDQGVALMSTPLNHLSWSSRHVADIIDNVTTPVRIAADFSREGPAPDGVLDRHRMWFFDTDQGPLWDLGIYGVNLLTHWLGMPDGVKGRRVATSRELTMVDANAQQREVTRSYEVDASLTWSSGHVARFQCGFRAPPVGCALEIERAGGVIHIDPWSYSSDLRTTSDSGEEVVTPPSTRETQKFVHGLQVALHMRNDFSLVARHQRQVARTIATLELLESLPVSGA